MIPKEPAIHLELKALEKEKDEMIIEAQYMGYKFGSLSETINRHCDMIREEHRKLAEYIVNHS